VFDLTRPTFTGERAVAVDRARNVALDAEGAVLTGANSGGKTTLLETLCECTLLAHMGLGVPADAAEVGRFDAVVFHRRHASFNAGVLESTLRTIVPPVTREAETLMLVDEFEAITEPGRAADTLNGLVRLTVDAGAAGVFVTHLAEELAPLPDAAPPTGRNGAGTRRWRTRSRLPGQFNRRSKRSRPAIGSGRPARASKRIPRPASRVGP
jgi:dsDNA-specific endonuclease/ATPase MutS2